jgi:replicative DNA helicase
MSAQQILDRIAKERESIRKELYDSEGLLRLQETMAAYDGEYKLYSSEDIAKELADKPRPEGFKTGVEALDTLTGGFRQQQVVSMFAHTKHGKTEMAVWLMSLFPQLNPVLIPLEQGAEELLSQRIERGYAIPHFLAPKHNDPFVLTEWIEERVVEGIAKYNSKMVVIDHLGYIDNNGKDGKYKRENLAYRLGQVMKEIKGLAKKWDVMVLLLVHISEGDEGKPPQLQDIGNSSDIKKESDTVIAIWRKNTLKNKIRVHENKTMLSVLANRRFGRNGNVGLMFDTEKGVYYEENNWVESMVRTAEQAVDADSFYDEL